MSDSFETPLLNRCDLHQDTSFHHSTEAFPEFDGANDNIWKNKTVMIVEDVPSNYQLLAAYLARTGARIIHFDFGLPAFELLKSDNNIDLVLMDLRLPDLNGISVTRLIRSINSEVPIIAQTAFAMQGDRERCLEAGCSDYIAKPIRKQDFLSIVGKYMN